MEAGPAALAARPALLAQLRRKDVTFGRTFVMKALAALGPDAAAAVPDLVTLLVGDHESHETSSLADALRSFGPALLPFAPQLTEALRQPARARVHAAIVELLAGLIPHGFEAFPVLHEVLRRAVAGDFYATAGHRSDYLRREITGAAIAGLAALGPAAAPALPDLVLADQTFASSELRQRLLVAYGAIGGAAVPHIRAALADRDRDVRVAAIKALGETGDTSAESQEALRRAEMDANRMVRARATSALRSLATRKAKRK